MAVVRTIQNAFNAGEFSPLMEGRSDNAKYHNAAETIQNMVCFKHGGVYRRPGTRFVNEVKTSTKKTRLIPFIFSTVQAYIIEVGDTYMRFYKNGARIESPPGTPIEISTPYLETEIFDIHFTQSADVLYIAHLNHFPSKLSRTSDTAWTLTDMGTNPTSGATDRGYLAGPFMDQKVDLTITPSATTGVGITLTASSAFFVSTMVGGLIQLKHGTTLGYAKITAFTSSTLVTATVYKAFGTATASDAYAEGSWSAYRGFPSSVTLFQQRSWWAGTNFQPDTIWGSQTSSYENFDAGTGQDDEAITFTLASNKVNAIRWMAPSNTLLVGTSGQEWQIGDPNASTPITPSNPLAGAETTFGSSTVSPIQVHNAVLFMQRAGRKLREFSFQFQTNSYVGPDMTLLSEHITVGGITQMDYQQELDSVVWMIRADGTLVGMTYERPQDVIAWHRQVTGRLQDLSDGKFESIAVIPHPTATEDQAWVIVQRHFDVSQPILTILAFPSPPGQTTIRFQVIAHGLIVGNSVVISGTSDPTFEGFGIALFIFNVPDADHFEVFLPYNPTMPSSGSGGFATLVGGTTKRYIEYLDTQSGYYGPLQVDAGLTYSGAATATLTGLSHLNGQIVDILGNGAVYPQQVVIAGQITGLSPQVTQAEVGLNFDSKLVTLRPEAGGSQGTAMGVQKRYSEIIVRLYKSIGVTINGDTMEFREPADPMNQPVPVFTGDKRVTNLGWDKDARIVIEQRQPLPFILIALIGTLSVG